MMRRFRIHLRLGLAARLNLIILGAVFAASLGIGAFLVVQQQAYGERKLREEGSALARLVAQNSEYAIYTANSRAALEAIRGVASHPELLYVALLLPDGAMVAHRSFHDAELPPLAPGALERAAKEGRVVEERSLPGEALPAVEFMVPVVASRGHWVSGDPLAAPAPAEPIGYVALALSQEAVRAENAALLRSTALVTALVLLIATAVASLLTRRIVSPLRRLNEATRAIAAGRLGRRVEGVGDDELGDLAHAFNQMSAALVDSHARVEEYRRTLEQRVDERTRQLQEANEHAMVLARTDALTGLFNRARFNDELQLLIDSSSRHGRKLAVLFIDLDQFKRINDTLGHQIGDMVLRAVADRLAHCVRRSDLLARLGGDEFVLAIPEIESSASVTMVAGKIFEVLAQPLVMKEYEFTLGCSIGVSIYPDHGADAITLLKNADMAMYHSKESMRGGLTFYADEMNSRAAERMELERGLRKALVNDELFLVFQPQAELATGAVVGLEALVRWRHPELGLISPDRFIPIAEETGIILPLGEWVMKNACLQLREWQDAGLDVERISVNLSARQFQQDIVSLVSEVLDSTGLPAHCLKLELTESLLVENAEKAVATLRGLKEKGVTVSVDDFGTGYSSLSYLTRFSIDYIKVDKSFVQAIGKNRTDETVVGAIIALAHALGLKVIAEGVETLEQRGFLVRLGCEEIQGYLLSRPLPKEEIEQLLKMPLLHREATGTL